MIEALNIFKSFGPVRAVQDVSLSIQPGEIVALAGENGSGKSTFAKILAGVHQPDAGHVAVDGQLCGFRSPAEAMRAGIALVAQELTAVPHLSVAENVLLGTEHRPFRWVHRKSLIERAKPLLEMVGLDVDPTVPFRLLGGGARELVEVAKGLAEDPRLLILDEATSRLDSEQAQHLFSVIRKSVAGGMAAILITHRLHEIPSLADRAVILRDGRHVGDLEGMDMTEGAIGKMMVGRPRPARMKSPRMHAEDEPIATIDGLIVAGSKAPLSLSVAPGEIVGLAGLVGSGRSELLETILGCRRPTAGSVTVRGTAVRPGRTRESIRSGIAIVPEQRHIQGLILGASVRRNVALGHWESLGPIRREDEERMTRDTVTRLRVKAPTLDTPVSQLSGGNQQKVVLSRCLAGKPALLLLDEPTVGVDIGAREEIYDIVLELCESGVGVILASSDMTELLRLSDRILVLHEQAVVGEVDGRTATEEQIAILAGGVTHAYA